MAIMPLGMIPLTCGKSLKEISAKERTRRKDPKAPKAIKKIEKITTPLERVISL